MKQHIQIILSSIFSTQHYLLLYVPLSSTKGIQFDDPHLYVLNQRMLNSHLSLPMAALKLSVVESSVDQPQRREDRKRQLLAWGQIGGQTSDGGRWRNPKCRTYILLSCASWLELNNHLTTLSLDINDNSYMPLYYSLNEC